MKVYSLVITDYRKKKSFVHALYVDQRKAYKESIWYNLSDLEENNIDDEKYPSQIKNFIKAYFDNDSLISIDQLKLCLDTFALSRLIQFQELLQKFQRNRPYFSVSEVEESKIML
jgi:hypothetical protein